MDTTIMSYGSEYYSLDTEVRNVLLPTMSLTAAKEDLYIKLTELQDLSDASEGLWDAIKSVLTSIGNVTMHMVNLTKTYIFKFYKSLKRTEIVYYNESNKISMMRILSCTTDELADLKLPFPNGLSTTYLDALDKTEIALSQLDILTRANVGLNVANKILFALRNRDQLTEVVQGCIASVDTTSIQIPVDQALRCLDEEKNTSREERTFTQLFNSVQELKKCNEKAISFTKHVDMTNQAHKKIAQISDIFTEIVKVVERSAGNGVNKEEVEMIAKLSYILGDTFDAFAKCLLQFHVLEHNLVEVYKEIRRQKNL